MVMLVYILTYANNKPKPFSSDTNVKIVKQCDYFDFTAVADEIDLKTNKKLKVKGKITNVQTKLTDVKVTFEVHTNWTTKTDVTGSECKFNEGKAINPSTTTETYSTQSSLDLKVTYPVKVMPLVKVKKPILYAKVTYTRETPATTISDRGTVTETVYYKISYSTYCVDGITVIK